MNSFLRSLTPEQQVGLMFVLLFGLLLLATGASVLMSLRERRRGEADEARHQRLQDFQSLLNTSWIMVIAFWVAWATGEVFGLVLFGLVSFFILREFFHGNTQFQDFLDNLPISSSILSGRLGYLVSVGFIERGDESARSGYALTRKGLDIYGPMILMKHWGDAWLRDGKRPAMQFVDARSRDERTAVLVCSSCGEAPDPRDVAYRAGYDLEDI